MELIDANASATKAQERETLEKIREMVAELDPQSYLGTAFAGVFEDAEQNIEFAPVKYLTPKKSIAQIARERAEQAEAQNIDVYEAIAGLYEEIAALTERVEELEGGKGK